MADRFGDCNSVLIESFKDNTKNKNTKLSTVNWLKVWKTWAKGKAHDENIELYEPGELNKLLEQFYATVRKQEGTDYELDSLRVMATAIDRHLKENEYKYSIMRDRQFWGQNKFLRERPEDSDKTAKESGQTNREV